jgi:hypothetical protein
MLVFETHVGLGENADLGQTADSSTGQAEPTTKRYLWFYWHEYPPLLRFLLKSNRAAQCFADHLLRAPRPTLVKPWVVDADRQVVAAAVMTRLGARWASTNVISAHLADLADVLKDLEFLLSGDGGPRRRFWRARLAYELCRHGLSDDKTAQVFLRHFLQLLQI